jgi:hypothetical protein
MPHFHSVHHKSQITWPEIEPGPTQWEVGDYPSELGRGPSVLVTKVQNINKWDFFFGSFNYTVSIYLRLYRYDG